MLAMEPAQQHRQRLASLKLAQDRRLGVARLRIEIGSHPTPEACRRLAAEILDAGSLMQCTRVTHALLSIKRVGHAKVNTWLTTAGVRSGDRKLRDLTPRQRQILADELCAYAAWREAHS